MLANKHPPYQGDGQNTWPVLHFSSHLSRLLIAGSFKWYSFSPLLDSAAHNHFQHEQESSTLEVVVSAAPGTTRFVLAEMVSCGSLKSYQQRKLLKTVFTLLCEPVFWGSYTLKDEIPQLVHWFCIDLVHPQLWFSYRSILLPFSDLWNKQLH